MATRGFGFLEGFLARQRARMANQLIPQLHRGGRLLDIGCGAHPYFLFHTQFREKYGVDQVVSEALAAECVESKTYLISFDIHRSEALPFKNQFFDVVTMLAVFEHVEPRRLPTLLGEVYRVLRPGGIFILTTPAAWTDYLLKTMAKLRLVSPVEIEDHKDTYTHSKIAEYLEASNFRREKSQFGYFEFRMNLWASSQR
ncbi:MAG: class I SAM-dependent methyltransferase [Nitrospirota bacterium]